MKFLKKLFGRSADKNNKKKSTQKASSEPVATKAKKDINKAKGAKSIDTGSKSSSNHLMQSKSHPPTISDSALNKTKAVKKVSSLTHFSTDTDKKKHHRDQRLQHDKRLQRIADAVSHSHIHFLDEAEIQKIQKPKWDPRIDIVIMGRDKGFKEYINELWWEEEDKSVYEKVNFRWVQINEFEGLEHKKINFWFLPNINDREQIQRFLADLVNIPVIFIVCAYTKEDVLFFHQIADLQNIDCFVQIEKYIDGASLKGVYDPSDLRKDLKKAAKEIEQAARAANYQLIDLTQIATAQDKEKLATYILDRAPQAQQKREQMKVDFQQKMTEYEQASQTQLVEGSVNSLDAKNSRGSSIYGSK